MTVSTGNRGLVDFGDQLVLGQAGFDQVEGLGVHRLDNACRPAHIFQFLGRFDCALPVHQSCDVLERRVRQMLPE